MSESDDTDVLLLIPPDLFIVPSTESEDDFGSTKPGVVSEIIEHVQSLESRVFAIESRDSSADCSLSQTSLLKSPSRHNWSLLNGSSRSRRCASVPSTPCSLTNKPIAMREGPNTQPKTSWDKHEQSSLLRSQLHANDNNRPDNRNTSLSSKTRRSLFSSNSYKSTDSERKVDDMNLVEVEQMLREIEMAEQKKIDNSTGRIYQSDFLKDRELLMLSHDDSTQYADPDKLIADFKSWKNEDDSERSRSVNKNEQRNGNGTTYRTRNTFGSDLGTSYVSNCEKPSVSKIPDATSMFFDSLNNTKVNGSDPVDEMDLFAQGDRKGTLEEEMKNGCYNKKNNGESISDSCLLKSQRLLALSDFWEQDDSKSPEEMLRIKFQEEKLRREHCEYLIQELQKKLLEQQEKVAVAIRIDNKKNSMISQFQSSWEKLKQRYQNLETEYNNSQSTLKSITERHQTETTELQMRINKCQGELSQALDLAAGYKEKSDALVKDKTEMARMHAEELEKYKALVQQKEKVCDQIKEDCNKLMDKNHQLEELLRNAQQDLSKERTKNGEVRKEMAAIHAALDTCGAELTTLRQEKDGLQLKLKEEMSRVHNLEQNKVSLLSAVEAATKAEKQAKEETATLLEQQDKARCELRAVYQKQLDEVVKAKQLEFQTQLDSAEVGFQTELETKQRAIAECATRKIKTIIDKHQLEINLLEEKHKEEKRLYELQLAQVVQKTTMLEAQLNSQQANKNQLVEQLHSVMQRQWQQALRIISGGNGENLAAFQQINVDKFFDLKNEMTMNHAKKMYQDPMKLEANLESRGLRSREDRVESLITLTSNDDAPTNSKKDGKNDLRGYIQMILDMQQSSNDMLHSRMKDSNVTPPPIYREVPKKHYTKKELSIMSEDSVTWQPASEASGVDTSEYVTVPQKLGKDQRMKPPWK